MPSPALIAGTWKHANKTAWIKIGFREGTGYASILQHDTNSAAQGLMLIRNITTRPAVPSHWQGEMYAADTDDFRPAILALVSSGVLVISVQEDNGGQTEVLRLIRSE